MRQAILIVQIGIGHDLSPSQPLLAAQAYRAQIVEDVFVAWRERPEADAIRNEFGARVAGATRAFPAEPSMRRIVTTEIPARAASSACSSRSNARAARICSGVISMIDICHR
jgi:hypothetical protein